MDDAARFLPEYASGVRNASTQVATLDFWSVDLNSHLYQEKRLLAFAARELGDDHAAAAWTSDADALLPRLASVPRSRSGEGVHHVAIFSMRSLAPRRRACVSPASASFRNSSTMGDIGAMQRGNADGHSGMGAVM